MLPIPDLLAQMTALAQSAVSPAAGLSTRGRPLPAIHDGPLGGSGYESGQDTNSSSHTASASCSRSVVMVVESSKLNMKSGRPFLTAHVYGRLQTTLGYVEQL